MSAVTSNYATGYLAVVTIGTSTYAKAKYFTLPDPTAGTVTIPHLGGFQKQPDGRLDFGKISVAIPQDGAGTLLDPANSATISYFTVSVAPAQGPLSGKVYTATSAYCTKDGGGNLARGSSVDRMLEFDLLQDGTWA